MSGPGPTAGAPRAPLSPPPMQGAYGPLRPARGDGGGLEEPLPRAVATALRRQRHLDHPALLYATLFEAPDDPAIGDSRPSTLLRYAAEAGQPLSALAQAAPLPPRVLLGVAARVAEALHVAWSLPVERADPPGLVHGDLRAERIWISPRGTVRLAGVGAPSAIGRHPLRPEPDPSHAGDVFSLAWLTAHLLLREEPLPPPPDHDDLSAQVSVLAVRVRQRLEDPALANALEQALCHLPDKRPPADALRDALDQAADRQPGPRVDDWARVALPPPPSPTPTMTTPTSPPAGRPSKRSRLFGRPAPSDALPPPPPPPDPVPEAVPETPLPPIEILSTEEAHPEYREEILFPVDLDEEPTPLPVLRPPPPLEEPEDDEELTVTLSSTAAAYEDLPEPIALVAAPPAAPEPEPEEESDPQTEDAEEPPPSPPLQGVLAAIESDLILERTEPLVHATPPPPVKVLSQPLPPPETLVPTDEPEDEDDLILDAEEDSSPPSVPPPPTLPPLSSFASEPVSAPPRPSPPPASLADAVVSEVSETEWLEAASATPPVREMRNLARPAPKLVAYDDDIDLPAPQRPRWGLYALLAGASAALVFLIMVFNQDSETPAPTPEPPPSLTAPTSPLPEAPPEVPVQEPPPPPPAPEVVATPAPAPEPVAATRPPTPPPDPVREPVREAVPAPVVRPPDPVPVVPVVPVESASSAGRVRVEGDALQVRLLSSDGTVYGMGEVPPGRYTVEAKFTTREMGVAGEVRVPSGGEVVVNCREAFMTCKTR